MAPVPASLPTFTNILVADPVCDAEATLLVAVLVAAAVLATEEVVVAPAPSAEAFFEPQTNEWQKLRPGKSLGCAFTHCVNHSSHSSEGRVWPKSETFPGVPDSQVQVYSRAVYQT